MEKCTRYFMSCQVVFVPACPVMMRYILRWIRALTPKLGGRASASFAVLNPEQVLPPSRGRPCTNCGHPYNVIAPHNCGLIAPGAEGTRRWRKREPALRRARTTLSPRRKGWRARLHTRKWQKDYDRRFRQGAGQWQKESWLK